jgi:CBS domain-containing protein
MNGLGNGRPIQPVPGIRRNRDRRGSVILFEKLLKGDLPMRTVHDLLRAKNPGVWSVRPTDTVYDALRLLAEKNVGALLVLDNERLVGILSERDYARKVILQGKTSRETLVREIMTPDPVCVTSTQTIPECMALMTDKRIRHLPVVEGGQVVGLISIGDVVKDIISEQEFMITQLEHYITGER